MRFWGSIFQLAMLVLRECTHSSPPEKTSFGSCWAAWVRGKSSFDWQYTDNHSQNCRFFIWVFCRQTVASRVNVFDSRNHAQALWRLNPWKLCDSLHIGAGCLWALQESSEQWLKRHLLKLYIMFLQSVFHKQHIRPLQGSPVYT